MRNASFRHLRSLALVVATVIFAACGSSNSAASSTSTTGGSTTPATPTSPPVTKITNLSDYCSLVSIADISRITNLSLTHTQTVPVPSKNQVTCSYFSDVAANSDVMLGFFVESDAGQGQLGFQTEKQYVQTNGVSVTDLSGIGDKAFVFSQKGVEIVVVLKGRIYFVVTGFGSSGGLSIDILKQLAQFVLGKL